MTVQPNGGTGSDLGRAGFGRVVVPAPRRPTTSSISRARLGGLNRTSTPTEPARISGVVTTAASTYGSGTLELTAANTYDNTTSVQAGRLVVNNATGSGTGTSFVEVKSGATLAGGGKIVGTSGVYTEVGSRIEPGGTAGNTLSIQIDPGGVVTFQGAWAVKLTATGAGGVATNSGGSTAGSVVGSNPDPIDHNFLDLSTNGTSGGVLFNSTSTWEIDGAGLTFLPYTRYSYVIGRAGAGEVDLGGGTTVTDQSRFSTIGFAAYDFSIESMGNGQT